VSKAVVGLEPEPGVAFAGMEPGTGDNVGSCSHGRDPVGRGDDSATIGSAFGSARAKTGS
jgi:hypothetical protein